MAKQIKLGFDKIPAPITESFPQLQDIEGNLLYDTAGNPLLTEEKGELSGFSRAANSTSLHINNDALDNSGFAGTVPIEEQFPDISPVSNTLLGVPRAEEQLSLFSDVSTYGLDEDNWVKFIYSDHGVHPREWYTRRNPVYGNRTETQFVEETSEQALYLKTFPTQFGYSPSPRWGNTEDAVPLPSDNHKLYMKFIAMGKFLFEKYSSVPEYKEFAARYFIDRTIKIIDANDGEVTVDVNTFQYEENATDFTASPPRLENSNRHYTVDYGDISETENAFAKVESWTMAYQGIIAETFVLPDIRNEEGESIISNLDRDAIRVFLTQETRPGGSTGIERFGIIESKQTFRYQPGRISGFTFGTRMKTPGERSSDIIEWGCANDTDEYIFQLRGIEWSIIRRSTLPLGVELLERQGLSEQDEKLVYPIRLDNNQEVQLGGANSTGTHWETKIPRDKWNGDNLLGGGRSGYTITFENVTMYKIEFSWYGAIGAKFYAYVPSENGEARWILLHTFVIENGMKEPVLKNPDLKFKYLLYNTDTEFVTSPSFIFKYGSSYYIDGGDEGTVRLTSFTGDTKSFSERTPLLGLLPKNNIVNSTGDEITNNKRVYPEKISINSTQAARIDIEAINGSPFGGHYFYSPSLHNGNSALSKTDVILQFGPNGDTLTKYDTAGNVLNWTQDDHEAHVIADGIYNTYIGYDPEDTTQAKVLRRRTGNGLYPLSTGKIAQRVKKYDGTTFKPRPTEQEFLAGAKKFTAKLTGYNSLAACPIPITENRFKIHFLNPNVRTGNHFADFLVGITDKKPVLDNFQQDPDDENSPIISDLRFEYVDDEGTTRRDPFNKETEFYTEWTSDSTTYDIKDREYQEQDSPIGQRLQVDIRLPNPSGENSGFISSVKGEISTQNYLVDSIEAASEPDNALIDIGLDSNAPVENNWYKVVFTSTSPGREVLNISGNSEVGYFDTGTSVFYTTSVLRETTGSTKLYCYISGDPSANISKDLNEIDYVQAKTLTLASDWQLEGYDENGNQKFGSHRWIIPRGVKFNIKPLYLVFGMTDGAKINNIYVEQIKQSGTSTFTPNYIFSQDGLSEQGTRQSSIQEVNVEGSANVLNPASFVSEDRLSGVRFDSSLTQPLRPGTNVYSFYVGANQPTTLDLSKVFNFDRKALTKGLVNNVAYYITATGELQDQSDGQGGTETVRVGGDIEVSLTVKEQ